MVVYFCCISLFGSFRHFRRLSCHISHLFWNSLGLVVCFCRIASILFRCCRCILHSFKILTRAFSTAACCRRYKGAGVECRFTPSQLVFNAFCHGNSKINQRIRVCGIGGRCFQKFVIGKESCGVFFHIRRDHFRCFTDDLAHIGFCEISFRNFCQIAFILSKKGILRKQCIHQGLFVTAAHAAAHTFRTFHIFRHLHFHILRAFCAHVFRHLCCLFFPSVFSCRCLGFCIFHVASSSTAHAHGLIGRLINIHFAAAKTTERIVIIPRHNGKTSILFIEIVVVGGVAQITVVICQRNICCQITQHFIHIQHIFQAFSRLQRLHQIQNSRAVRSFFICFQHQTGIF